MNEKYMDLLLKFINQVLKQAKTYKVRFQAKYHLPTDDFPEMGWILCADWKNKKNKHIYTKIILEDK